MNKDKTFSTRICPICNEEFKINNYEIKRPRTKKYKKYCSRKCSSIGHNKKVTTNCEWCKKEIAVIPAILKSSKSGYAFCNSSCAASYNNSIREQTRRSKIEKNFYDLLVKEFPTLKILPNDKTMLDGFEIDVAIPELELGIEWNGIVHFKPIYGENKLKIIQNRDNLKRKIASKKDINLIVISDLVSNDKILQKAFKDVKNIITQLTEEVGNDPTLP